MAQERLTVRKIKEILRLKYEAQLSNRAIAGACKVSNSTVGEYLRRASEAGVNWPLVEIGEEELYAKLFPEKIIDTPERTRPMPNWQTVHQEKKRKGVTLRLLWQEYKESHPDGYQYSQFCEHYRRWKKGHIDPSMRIEHKGGERMQVDYAGQKIPIINSETKEITQASVFVAVLPASNYTYAEAQLNENQSNWNNGHVRAFEYFGGVVKIVVPDNLKTGVKKPNYYEPGINLAYQDLAEHYKFAVLPTRVRKPRDKGKVENGVQNVERWVMAPLRDRQFFSLSEANQAIQEQLEILNNKTMGAVGRSRKQEFEEIDKPNLRPLPERRYEYAQWKTAGVNIDYHVEFDKHLYSVPNDLIYQQVEIRATERMVEIFHQGKSVTTHPRNFRQGRFSTNPEHMPSNHRFVADLNAENLISKASKIGPQTTELIKATLKSRHYPEQAFRTCLGILNFAQKYEHQLIEQACRAVYESKEFTYQAVKQELNWLHKQPETIIIEPLPTHKNIRGADYFQERKER